MNVYKAAKERIAAIYDKFGERVYLSFSAGKDSSVMLHLALEIAKEKGHLPVNALFIDLEAQYQNTIAHAEEMLIRPDIKAYWICLPIHLRNAVSMYNPQWVCWNPDEKEKWVRSIPEYPCVISDTKHFPFYRYGMEFEEFVVEFGKWFANGKPAACGVGIRMDESINRFRTIHNKRKGRWNGKAWTTKITDQIYNFYPLYDWRTEDIWASIGKNNWSYNKIYDLMYQRGWSIHECRICQPYGDDQRKGLDLFRFCEPETWSKVVDRVSGANFGNIYCRSFLIGHKKVKLPEGHTWKSYTEFLLETIPRYEKEWFTQKFRVFQDWWAIHGYPDGIPDMVDPHLEASRKAPSWRRLAKVILKNDKLCKGLSFSQTKNQFRKYRDLREAYGERN
jgi:predicted phosphoadenosine phosphosulfate sulfurtransferase